MKSINKKILTVLVTLLLLIGTLGGTLVSAYADNSMFIPTESSVHVYADGVNIEYNADEEYSVSVRANVRGSGVTTFQLALEVPGFLNVTNVSTINDSQNSSLIVNKNLDGIKISYTSQDYVLQGDCELFAVTFKVVTAGDYIGRFGVNHSFENMFVTANASQIPFTYDFGEISVYTQTSSVVMGDLNLDGEVTLADVICLQRYIVTDNEGIRQELFTAGDIDRNGQLNSIDVQYIQMYLVNAIPSLDDVNGGNGDETQNGYSLCVVILDVNGKIIRQSEWHGVEEGTLYPAIVGQFVSSVLDEFSTEVSRIISDCYGEMSSSTAEQTPITQNDIVHVYLATAIEGDMGDIEEKERATVLIDGDYAEIVLYSDSTFFLFFEGQMIDKGFYQKSDDNVLRLSMVNGVTVTLDFDSINGYYYISSVDSGGSGGEGGENIGQNLVMHYYYFMEGSYVEIGGSSQGYVDPNVTVYDYAVSNHYYGEAVKVSKIYYDQGFVNEVPNNEMIQPSTAYHVILEDVALAGAFEVYEQRVSMQGSVSVEKVGMATFANGVVTIVYDGMEQGSSYPFAQQLGQVDIIRGQYSQILAQVTGNMLVIFQDLDLSGNQINEDLSAIQGEYTMSVPFAPIPYRITLFANNVCSLRSGGEVRILSEYFLEEGRIYFSMLGQTMIVQADKANGTLNYVGGSTGGGENVNPGNPDVPEENLIPAFIGYVSIDNDLYPILTDYERIGVSTIGEYVEFLENKMTGLRVVSIHEYDINNAPLENSDNYDNGAAYVAIVADGEIFGTYQLAIDRGDEGVTFVGNITLTETNATIVGLDGVNMICTYSRLLNQIEVKVGDYNQICLTMLNGVAFIEYTFDGSSFETDVNLNDFVGSYTLSVNPDGAFSTIPMTVDLYSNGVCRMYVSIFNIGMYYKYDITNGSIYVYEDEDISVYVIDKVANTITLTMIIRDESVNGGDNAGDMNGTVTDKNEDGFGGGTSTDFGKVNFN